MSFQIIATLLVVILVGLFIYSKPFRKKELQIAELERKYFDALTNKDEEAAFKHGLEYFMAKGLSEEKAISSVEKDLEGA